MTPRQARLIQHAFGAVGRLSLGGALLMVFLRHDWMTAAAFWLAGTGWLFAETSLRTGINFYKAVAEAAHE